MEKLPSKSSTREIVEAAVEGAAGMIPIVGSPIAVALAISLNWGHNQRTQRWFESLAEAVDELQQQMAEPLAFEDLADNDTFLDAVIAATRAAQATHQAAKLDALRNGVLNSLGPNAPELDEQARFFRLVDQFTASHLLLLQFLADPARWFGDRGIEKPSYMAAGRSALLERGVPEFAGKRDWYDLLAGDLSSAGLANPNLHTVMTGTGVWESGLTALGRRFLAFITDPRDQNGES